MDGHCWTIRWPACVYVYTCVFFGGNNRVWYSQCWEEPCGRNLRVGACWRRSSHSLSLSKASLSVSVWTCPGLTVNVMEFTHVPVHSFCHLLSLIVSFTFICLSNPLSRPTRAWTLQKAPKNLSGERQEI